MRAVALVVMVLLAGCSAPPADVTEPTDSSPVAILDQVPMLALGLDHCWAVGGLSIYPLGGYTAAVPMPEGIALRDISDLTGDPAIASANGAGWLTPSDQITGHWHVALRCTDNDWGFVGIAIEPPAWDPEPAPLNLLLAVWSWDAALQPEVASFGHASQALEVDVTGNVWQASMLLSDDHNGRYEGAFNLAQGDPVELPDHMRFWMLLPTEGHHNHHDQTGPFAPVSYDLRSSPVDAFAAQDTHGMFVHSGTDHHAPLPALGGNALGIEWRLDDVHVTDGPRPDVALNTTWVH